MVQWLRLRVEALAQSTPPPSLPWLPEIVQPSSVSEEPPPLYTPPPSPLRPCPCAEFPENVQSIKVGEDPLSERPEVGKSTIIRAMKLQHTRRDRLETEVTRLKSELERNRKLFYATLALLVAAVIGLILALLVE